MPLYCTEAYICFLVFQLCTHSEMFAGEDEDEEEARVLGKLISGL